MEVQRQSLPLGHRVLYIVSRSGTSPEEHEWSGVDKGTATWHLLPDGSWVPHTTDEDGNPLLDMQEYLINAKSRRRAAMK